MAEAVLHESLSMHATLRGVKARLLEIARDGGSENWMLLIMFEVLAARYFA